MVFLNISICTDGASRGNPGDSASGFQIYDESGKVIAKKEIYNGIKTNNYAEYNAIINALLWCIDNTDFSNTEITLYSDSKLVVSQINGLYKIKSPEMMELNIKVKNLVKKLKSVKFINKPREFECIAKVDHAINLFLDKIELDKKNR